MSALYIFGAYVAVVALILAFFHCATAGDVPDDFAPSLDDALFHSTEVRDV